MSKKVSTFFVWAYSLSLTHTHTHTHTHFLTQSRKVKELHHLFFSCTQSICVFVSTFFLPSSWVSSPLNLLCQAYLERVTAFHVCGACGHAVDGTCRDGVAVQIYHSHLSYAIAIVKLLQYSHIGCVDSAHLVQFFLSVAFCSFCLNAIFSRSVFLLFFLPFLLQVYLDLSISLT